MFSKSKPLHIEVNHDLFEQDKDHIPLLRVENLTKFYYEQSFFAKKFLAIDKVSFTLERGKIFGITGNNSCGKSTIAGILTGLIQPDGGQIYFDGKKLSYGDVNFRREHIRLASIQQVETFNLPINVNEFLEITLDIVGIPPDFTGELLQKIFTDVNAPINLGNKLLSRLNKQEMSLVALAHALILDPEIIVIDDLFATLDLSFKGVLINILLDLQKAGRTIVLITSDLGIIKHVTDEVMILQDGIVEDIGSTYEVLTSTTSEFTRRMIKTYFGRSLNPSDWSFSFD